MKYFLLTALAILVVNSGVAAATELTVYSARKEHLVKPVLEAYTEQTGVKVNLLTDKGGVLIERLKAEGDASPADLFITVDAGNLWYASEQGLFTPVASEIITHNIPEHFRSPTNSWIGLSVRARTIVYNTDKVDPRELSTYEALADADWNGRLCLRTSKKVYNQSLVAMMIAEKGTEETRRIVEGWVDNLAAPVFANDTAVLEAVAAGQCDAGIVNTYYFGRLLKKKPELPIRLFWPNQSSSGVHVNVSGAGILKTSKNKQAAQDFLEWLTQEDAQHLFSDSNLEYPANATVDVHPIVQNWGTFKQNIINVSRAGELQKVAIMLMDRAGYK